MYSDRGGSLRVVSFLKCLRLLQNSSKGGKVELCTSSANIVNESTTVKDVWNSSNQVDRDKRREAIYKEFKDMNDKKV